MNKACLKIKFKFPEINRVGMEGLTVPIIGIMLVIIIYLAFKEQIKNKHVTLDMKVRRIETPFFQMLDLHIENVKNFVFIPNKASKYFTGRMTFDKLQKIFNRYYNNSNKDSSKNKTVEAYNLIF